MMSKKFFLYFIFFLVLPLTTALTTNASTLYFKDISETPDFAWDTVANWWTDAEATIPAAALPLNGDVVNIESNLTAGPSIPVSLSVIVVNNVLYDVVFTGASGPAIFNGACGNAGTVDGNAEFNNGSNNYGTVTGDAIFSAESKNNNAALVQGNAIFWGTSKNQGTVTGYATFFDSSINDLGSVGGTGTFNNSSSNNGTVIGAAYFYGSSISEQGSYSADVNFYDSSYNNASTITSATFNGSSRNDINGTIGTAVFNDTSINNGSISILATFNGNSLNTGTVASSDFYGSSYNDYSGNVTTATFNNTSFNNYGTVGTAIFNDSSFNDGSVSTATFNSTSYNNNGTVENATFSGQAYNAGTVTFSYGTMFRNDAAVTTNNGTITTNIGSISGNDGTVTTNSGTIGAQNNIVETNNGTIESNNNFGFITTNNGTVTINSGSVTTNSNTGSIPEIIGVVETNNGSIGQTYNGSSVTDNYGTVSNNNGGTITNNYGTVTDNSTGSVSNNYGTIVLNGNIVSTNMETGIIQTNSAGSISDNIAGGVVGTNDGYIYGGIYTTFVVNDNGYIEGGSFCQSQAETGGTINAGTFSISNSRCYNAAPGISISPTNLSVLNSWTPGLSFATSTSCSYKIDSGNYVSLNCASPSIPAPSNFPHLLTIVAENQYRTATSTLSFIYSTLLGIFTGSLTPYAVPAPTYHTLTDIYNVIMSGTPSTAGNHTLSTSQTPNATTGHSTSEIYVRLANLIDASTIKPGITYLGVTGGGETPDPIDLPTSSLTPTGTPNDRTGFSLEDIYQLVKNNVRVTSSTHSTSTSAHPTATTTHSIEDVYRTLTALVQPGNILLGDSYLGVEGAYVPMEGLAIQYRMNDNTASTVVVDTSDNAINASSSRNTSLIHTDSGNPPSLNGAFAFNGTSDGVTVLDSATFTNNFTIAFWYYADSDSTGTRSLYWIHVPGYNNYFSQLSMAHNLNVYGWSNYDGTNNPYNNSIPTASLGAWHFVVVERNLATSKMSLYIDNVSVGEFVDTTIGTEPVYNELYIGRDAGPGYLKGKMDDFRVYDRVLTTDEKSQLYNSGLGNELI